MSEIDPRWYETFFDADWLNLATSFPPERTIAECDFLEKALGLGAGARVLDLACGHGRHSIELARRGLAVTGLDISQPSLQVARDAAARQGAGVLFVDADMRRIPFEGYFDAVVNIYTAFGYLESDEEDQRVLDAVARSLVPGGRFVVDTLNPSGLARRHVPRAWSELPDGTLLLEERAFDAAAGRERSRWLFVHPDGTRVEKHFTLRLYTPVELQQMLERAGLAVEQRWGGFDGSDLALESHRMIVLARKQG